MKLYLEDLICRLASEGPYLFDPQISLWKGDDTIIYSLAQNPAAGRGYTEKQRNLVIRLVKKYQNQLITHLGQSATDAIDLEEFKFNLVEPRSQTKSISIEDKKILVSFPYDEALVATIKKFRDSNKAKLVDWNMEKKVWAFDLEELNVVWIGNNLVPLGFSVDKDFFKIFEEISLVMENIESHIPMLIYTESGFKFINGHKTLPQLATNNVIEAVLLAKYYGISVWDENVANFLKNEEISPVLDKFINESDSENLNFDSTDISIDQFKLMFKFNMPTLIIIPAGHELKYLKSWHSWLKSQNFSEKEISVMFRLDNTSGRDFNDYVRTFDLNTPIHEHTKVVFISQKLPKPIIKSGIDFKFVLNLGSISGVHYSIASYLQSRPDVIKYTDTKQKGYQVDVL